MLLLLGFSFLAGLVTPLTPCIWPILPILFSTSALGKGNHKPLGVTLGVLLSFGVLTLSLSTLVHVFMFDPNVLRIVAVIVIGLLGMTLVFPALSSRMEAWVSRLSSIAPHPTGDSGFIGGFLSGLVLGAVWTPCAGPILAAVATLAATGKVTGEVVLITAMYVLGMGIPLLIFAYGGRIVVQKTRFFSAYTTQLQQFFGILMLLTAAAIYTNTDTYLEAQLLNAFPGVQTSLNQFEQNDALTKQLNSLRGNLSQQTLLDTSGVFNANMPSPEITGITNWLNTPTPLTIARLKGKVVLVDFWTYTCINCIRTLPHVTKWYDTYKDQGFVVIGVHTPEFAFEHDTNNVAQAIKQFGIHYPVAQDNNYGTWNAFNNQYWPAEYLIDANGTIRRTEFGEGSYDTMEQAIRTLLQAAGKTISMPTTNVADTTPQTQLSPETYLGSARMQYEYPDGNTGTVSKTFPASSPQLNSFTFEGKWDVFDDHASAEAGGALNYQFYATHVYLVMKPSTPGTSQQVKVLLDGKTIDPSVSGADVINGMVTVDQDRLYDLVNLKNTPGVHTLRLEFPTSGVQLFAFTFG